MSLDRWGLPRPRDLGPMPHFQLMFLSSRYVDGQFVCYDIRSLYRQWIDAWHDIGVMRYYDSAWDEEEP